MAESNEYVRKVAEEKYKYGFTTDISLVCIFLFSSYSSNFLKYNFPILLMKSNLHFEQFIFIDGFVLVHL